MSELEATKALEDGDATPKQTASEEAEWDRILETMDSADEEIGEPAPEQEAKAEPEPEPEEENTDADNSVDREQPETEAADPDLEKSLTVLRRDGLPDGVISRMTDDEILSLAAKRSKVQSDTDDAYRQLQDLKKAKESDTESVEESETSGSEQPSYANLDEALEPFIKLYGEEAGEALKTAQQAALNPMIERLQAAQNVVEGMMLDLSRGKMKDQYPQLADEEGYARVKTRMENLIKTGEYSNIEVLMADASRLEFGEDAAVASREINERRSRQKAEGQMTPAGGGETPAHSLTDDERQEALLSALEEGMSTSDARRLYGS